MKTDKNYLFSKEYIDELINTINLKEGDEIEIINYGSLISYEKEYFLKYSKHLEIYREYPVLINSELKTFIDVDSKPELIGKTFTVESQIGYYVKVKDKIFDINQIKQI